VTDALKVVSHTLQCYGYPLHSVGCSPRGVKSSLHWELSEWWLLFFFNSVCSGKKDKNAIVKEFGYVITKLRYYVWTAMPSEKRISSYSPQHGDKGRCSFSLYSKFEMIL